MIDLKIPVKGWLANSNLQFLMKVLSQNDEEVLVNGGAVRNALLDEPVNDVDLSTTLLPDQVMKLLESSNISAVPTGIDHGTVTAVIDKTHYEITTLREDIETDGRHAIVKFGRDWAKDALRRDLTMNALYCDSAGRVSDPLNGLEDLKARRVRFIGKAEDRIKEDYLRILRFFRFFAWYGAFRPDAEGLKASSVLKSGLKNLSVERIWKELKILLHAHDPSRALLWMRTCGVLSVVLPETENWGIDLIPKLVAAEQTHGWQPDPLLRLMAITPPTNDVALSLSERLRFSNYEAQVLNAWSQAVLPETGLSDTEFSKFLYRRDPVAISLGIKLKICSTDEASDVEQYLAQLQTIKEWEKPVFPVSGNDLINKGIKAGPELGKVLTLLEQRWIESGFEHSKEKLLESL